MTAPRHLWSGDWRRESAAAEQELAGRRAPREEPTPIPPEVRSPPSGPSAAARLRAWLRAAREHVRARLDGISAPRLDRRIALIVIATLMSAAGAYAIVSSLEGSSSGKGNPSSTPPAAAGPAWLGVQMDSFPSGAASFTPSGGVLVTDVVPGSPADAAGIEPGDLITAIDNQSVATPNQVNAALARLHPGEQVTIQYQRGPFVESAQVTLEARPPGSP